MILLLSIFALAGSVWFCALWYWTFQLDRTRAELIRYAKELDARERRTNEERARFVLGIHEGLRHRQERIEQARRN